MEGVFPHFTNGDVTISIGQDIYRLHANRLGSKSLALRSLIEQAGSSGSIHLELIEAGDRYQYGRLVVQSNNTESHEWSQEIHAVWKNMFSTFYGLVLNLESQGEDSITEHCWGLADVAEQLQMKSLLVFSMNIAFAAIGERLFILIAADPISWINVARRVRHVWIFKEALIHIVGNWNEWEEIDMDSLNFDVRDLCEEVHHGLQRQKAMVDRRLVNFFPGTFTNPATNQIESLYANDTHMWIAVTLYRQWLLHQMTGNTHLEHPDSGASFYRSVAAGGPMQSDNNVNSFDLPIPFPAAEADINTIKRRLAQLSEEYAGLVKHLVANNSEYDVAVYGELPYLTCCTINDDDCPWYVKRDESESSLDLSEFDGKNLEQYMVERVNHLLGVLTNAASEDTQMEE
ncbi:hypothetical protein FE257_004752 [Aspergillus nanangensis]|uniref:Uncharacterized protein n=1 Tax=Aspergillus nanangensis TaxID=2582783 RepID=A0AAD4CRP3_ASPNN|nr:hypothetical protein FE257_004752 [Aspergillus nanangensis]